MEYVKACMKMHLSTECQKNTYQKNLSPEQNGERDYGEKKVRQEFVLK